MAITRVAHGTSAVASTGTTTMTPGAPASPAAGDLWLCFIASELSTSPVSMDAAWTEQFNVTPGTNRYLLFTFPYAGSTPTLTITKPTGNFGLAFIVAYRPGTGGVLLLDGTPPTSINTSSGTITYPDATPSQANEMCVFGWAVYGTASNSAISGSDPTPTEELDDSEATISTSIGYADGIRTASTGTGARTSTCSPAAANVGATVLLKELVPAAAVSGTGASGMTEADVVTGGKTLILTLTDTTWIPA